MLRGKKDYWFSVSSVLKYKRISKPFIDKETYVWIHMRYDHQFDSYTPIYKYDLFSPELIPINLNEGNFTITLLEDYCTSIGCGNHYSIKFSIIDKSNTKRTDFGFGQQIGGIIEVIKLLRELSSYEDWSHYDQKIPLAGANS